MKILAVIPAYNCEESLPRVVKGLHGVVDEIVVVNDGSNDSTGDVAKDLPVTLLTHIDNRGLGAALRTGFEYALTTDADIVVTLDADGQHAPGELQTVTERLIKNHCDVVIGSRLMDKSQYHKFPPMRLKGNLWLTSAANWAAGYVASTDSQSGYRAFKKDVLNNISLKSDRMRISTEIILDCVEAGYVIVDVPIEATYEDEVSTQRFFIDPPSILIFTIWRGIKYKIKKIFRRDNAVNATEGS